MVVFKICFKRLNMKLSFDSIILDIINAKSFKEHLKKINSNYSNLKQENYIRNYILEELNQYLAITHNTHYRAFAEHPRVNGYRVDLSIINQNDTNHPYTIEFKYQFSGDFQNMLNYWKIIKNDFEYRSSNLFILIVANWNKNEKQIFDNIWGLTSNLSRYISKSENWKENIRTSFKSIENSILVETERISLDVPYQIDYHFYILKNK